MPYSWTRSFAYWFGNYDEYKTDEPREKEISLKAVLMKQIVLSRLRLNKIKIKKNIPYDLQKIKPSNIKINMDDYKRIKTFKDVVVESLDVSWNLEDIPEKPVLKRQRVEQSQKQIEHIMSYPHVVGSVIIPVGLSYTERMKMLKSTL